MKRKPLLKTVVTYSFLIVATLYLNATFLVPLFMAMLVLEAKT